jgi:hypothetical protein
MRVHMLLELLVADGMQGRKAQESSRNLRHNVNIPSESLSLVNELSGASQGQLLSSNLVALQGI